MASFSWLTRFRNYPKLSDDELGDRTQAIYAQIKDSLARGDGKDGEVRNQLAELTKLLPDVQLTKSVDLINEAESAVTALTGASQGTAFAGPVILDLRQRTTELLHPAQAYFQVLVGPVRLVLLGLSCFVTVLILLRSEISGIVIWLAEQQLKEVNTETVRAIIVSGAVGATLSLVIRLAKFEEESASIRGVSLFLTGFFKPAIGTVFAIFVCGMIKSEILPIKVDDLKSDTFLISLAFITGFSERFAQDLFARAQMRVTPGK